jgi:hypothetical protein
VEHRCSIFIRLLNYVGGGNLDESVNLGLVQGGEAWKTDRRSLKSGSISGKS